MLKTDIYQKEIPTVDLTKFCEIHVCRHACYKHRPCNFHVFLQTMSSDSVRKFCETRKPYGEMASRLLKF